MQSTRNSLYEACLLIRINSHIQEIYVKIKFQPRHEIGLNKPQHFAILQTISFSSEFNPIFLKFSRGFR